MPVQLPNANADGGNMDLPMERGVIYVFVGKYLVFGAAHRFIYRRLKSQVLLFQSSFDRKDMIR